MSEALVRLLKTYAMLLETPDWIRYEGKDLRVLDVRDRLGLTDVMSEWVIPDKHRALIAPNNQEGIEDETY